MLSAFSDGDNLMIVDGIVYFHQTGNSYRDKLKHNLPLDYVICQNMDMGMECVMSSRSECSLSVVSQNLWYNVDLEDVIVDDDNVQRNRRKCVNVDRSRFVKRNNRNFKKSKVKQDGFAFKYFQNEQNLSKIITNEYFAELMKEEEMEREFLKYVKSVQY